MSLPNPPQPNQDESGSAEPHHKPEDSHDSVMDDFEDEAGWQTQTSKKRRHGSNSSEDTIITQPGYNLTVIVKPNDPTTIITNMNPLVLKQKLDSLAPDGVIQIRPNYRLNLLAIDARNVESTKALLQLKNLGTVQVQTYEPPPPSASVGIIRGVSADIEDADLLAAMREKASVIQVRRLGKSEIVKLVFATKSSPEYVTAGHTRYKVLPYLEKPRQCPKCNRFGHIASTCLKAQRCSRCGGDHGVNECAAEQPKCANCKKRHDATSKVCAIYKVERQISNYKSSKNVNYTSAKSAIENDQEACGTGRHWTPRKRSQGSKEDKQSCIPLQSEDNFPPLENLTGKTAPDASAAPPVQSGPSTQPSSASAATAKKGPSRGLTRPTRKHSEPPGDPKPIPNATPKPQSFGSAICTLAIQLRTFLTSLNFPFAQALVTVIDMLLPLASSWSR